MQKKTASKCKNDWDSPREIPNESKGEQSIDTLTISYEILREDTNPTLNEALSPFIETFPHELLKNNEKTDKTL